MDTRKEAILEAIVREYIESGSPVGSLSLVEKYSFPFSTATIRAEMAELERSGYLAQPHTSAGRVPTQKGYRYFVDMIEKERELLSREETVARKRIGSMQGRYEKQLETASAVLSDLTRSVGFAGFSGELFSHGLGHLFREPEFANPEKILKTAELLDNLTQLLYELPKQFETRIMIGSESPIGKSAGCSIIVSQFYSPFGRGYLGIVGPMRMPYGRNISAIKEVKKVLEEDHE